MYYEKEQILKWTTYKIQQAISKAINTTGPSVVTFCIEYRNPPPTPIDPTVSLPTPHPPHLTPPPKVNNNKKDNVMEQCTLKQYPPPHTHQYFCTFKEEQVTSQLKLFLSKRGVSTILIPSNDWFASSYLIQIMKENQLFQEKGSLNSHLIYNFLYLSLKHV